MIRLATRSIVCAGLASLLALSAQAAVPHYDHVLVVVMENHGLAQVVGNPAAPYVTGLARQGANFTNAHGIGHPSQPNYLALFSGSTQGVSNDSCPKTPFSTNNLAAQLGAAGLTFAGYSEGMPAPGYSGCRAATTCANITPGSILPTCRPAPTSRIPRFRPTMPTCPRSRSWCRT